MQHDTLNKLIFARLLCLPHNMVAAKSEETARKRLSERVEKDVLKLFPTPPPEFQHDLHHLVQALLNKHMHFSGTLLQLSEEAQHAAIAFLQLPNRRALNDLTWEQVRTVYLIALTLQLSERQQERVKNESKLQASILANYHHQIMPQTTLFHGTLGQVARELARLAIGAKSSRIGDLKKALLQQWAGDVMQAYLKNPVRSPATVETTELTAVTAVTTAVAEPKLKKPKGGKATGLAGFAEQVEAVLPNTALNHQQNVMPIAEVWQQWQSEHPHDPLDLVTFKQLLVEAGKRQLLQLMPAPVHFSLSEEELKDSAVQCGEIVCHLVQARI